MLTAAEPFKVEIIDGGGSDQEGQSIKCMPAEYRPEMRHQHTSVYKVETAARLYSDNQQVWIVNHAHKEVVSNCFGVYHMGLHCIALESHIHLFHDDGRHHYTTIQLGAIPITLMIDCKPDKIAFNHNATFLVIGDRLGTLHFLHLESRQVVLSQMIPEATTQTDAACFAYIGFSTTSYVIDELFNLEPMN
jgi:hypothetical protein